MDIANLKAGKYMLIAELLDREGEPLVAVSQAL